MLAARARKQTVGVASRKFVVTKLHAYAQRKRAPPVSQGERKKALEMLPSPKFPQNKNVSSRGRTSKSLSLGEI
jgi:hypothetical protein